MGVELDSSFGTDDFIKVSPEPQYQPTRWESHIYFPVLTLPPKYAGKFSTFEWVETKDRQGRVTTAQWMRVQVQA